MSKKFRLQHSSATGRCPYRLLNAAGQEIQWALQFLDAQCFRGLSPCSLRIYAYDLLNFARWWFRSKEQSLARLNESSLLHYVRYQLSSQPQPAPQTAYSGQVGHLFRSESGHSFRRDSGHPRSEATLALNNH